MCFVWQLPKSHVEMEAKHLSDFQGDILVRCPRCHACAHLLALQRPDGMHRGHRFVCRSCAHFHEWDLDSDGCIPLPASGPRLGGFGLDLWLATPCSGETLWAYNREHLQFLEDYISARLRTHSRHPEHGWSNSSIQSRLPRWMLARSNREAVLHGIEKLWQELKQVG